MDVTSCQDANQNLSQSARIDYNRVNSICEFIKSKINLTQPVQVGILCGSGLGTLADMVENARIVSYEDIPGFPITTVHGPNGCFVFGTLQSKPVVCIQARVHAYEGYSLAECALLVRVTKQLGAKVLVATSAVGGINAEYKVGDLILVKDHIFMPGFNLQGPLVGPNDQKLGPRFPSMNNIYDKDLRELAKKAAKSLNQTLHEGIYCQVGGPHFETPAELRLLKLIGADVVGMSTGHEAVVARHNDLKMVCFALVTNMAVMDTEAYEVIDINKEVFDEAAKAAKMTADLVKAMLDVII